jgi:UDP-GlcNAc:undecaprenyl-phosphate GlcNAc-1-phosphate transferase
MIAAATAFAISAGAAALLTPRARDWARRRGLLDHAHSSRKIHGRPVPRIGGVAIVAAFFAPLLGLLFVDGAVARLFRAGPHQVVALFVGGLAIAALGVYDDLRGADARKKLAVQLAVGAFMFAMGFRVERVGIPFDGSIELGALSLPVTMLWFAGVVNAMNLIDGLDGLAGGVAFIGLGSTFAVAVLAGDPLMMLFSAALAGAVLGFLFYNFNPASIFMGDSGSMFLGFVLAAASVQTNQKSTAAVAMVAPVVALGLPIGDTLLAMVRRLLRGRPVFQADREHIHHLLLARGFSQRGACLVLYGVALVLGVAAVLVARAASGWVALAVIAPLVVVAALSLRWLGYARLERAAEVARARRRNLATRARIREAAAALRRAHLPDEIWNAVRRAAPALGATCVAVRLPADGSVRRPPAFSHGFDEAGSRLLRAAWPVTAGRFAGASVELGWTDGRSAVDRDTEMAVELLCGHLATAVERLGALDQPPSREVLRPRRDS